MTESLPTFRSLTGDDLASINDLLRDNWPHTYGATGCPDFSIDYLRWLYGGPDADRHFLLGAFKNHELVGLKANLYRPTLHKGERLDVHVATHLTVDRNLALYDRMIIAQEMARLHMLDPDYPDYSSDALLAFFEEDKPLSRSTGRLAELKELNVCSVTFPQSILNPMALRDAMPPTGPVRICTETDADMMSTLLSTMEGTLKWAPGPEALWYHVSRAPGSAVYGIETDGCLSDFLACYMLDWVKGGRQSKVGIIEVAASGRGENLAALMKAAWEHATKCGARGVSMENTSYLPEEFLRAAGLMATPRRMTVALRSRRADLRIDEKFLLDVK